jgi:hypothetical protein
VVVSTTLAPEQPDNNRQHNVTPVKTIVDFMRIPYRILCWIGKYNLRELVKRGDENQIVYAVFNIAIHQLSECYKSKIIGW